MAWDNTTEEASANYVKLTGQTTNPSSSAMWICGFVRDKAVTDNITDRAMLSICKSSSTRNWMTLFKADASDEPYAEFYVAGGTNFYAGEASPATVVTSGWDKFLLHWNGSGTMSYFRNGTKYTDGSGTAPNTTFDEVVIGSAARPDIPDYKTAFYGQICYVCVGTTALSDAEAIEMTSGTYKPWTVAPAKVDHAWPLISNLTAAVGSNLSESGVTSPSWSADDPGLADYSSGIPSITDAGDEAFLESEASVTITGTGFGSSQGSGVVKLSPTDDVDDASAVSQTVNSWGDTSIEIAVVRGALPVFTDLYLFVTEDGGSSNAAGYVVQLETTPIVLTVA